ncbi:MAG: hypothetical protein GY866_05835, partial [Proteobacteria bacterium]|nr:hypothetical protein [Pseudomonadota bacterium]
MLAQDLRMKELVNMRPEFDEMLFGSQKFSHRIMLVPVLLIESCLDNLRSTVSPEVLHRMVASIAYEAGVASAVIMADIYEYTTSEDWLRAVSWFGAYFGFAKDEITQVEEDPGQNRFRIRGIWRDSFEADYLLKRDGVSDKPVCGFLTNSTSGAASTIFNREILVKEVQCKAQGHEYCVYEGRTAAEWDDGDPVGEKPIS